MSPTLILLSSLLRRTFVGSVRYLKQTAFFLGFTYHVSKHDNLQLGYMNVFQQLAAGNKYRSNHVARVFYFHNLDLRKK